MVCRRRLTAIDGLEGLMELRELYLSHNVIESAEGLGSQVRSWGQLVICFTVVEDDRHHVAVDPSVRFPLLHVRYVVQEPYNNAQHRFAADLTCQIQSTTR